MGVRLARRRQLILLLVIFSMALFIVNNGNILTEGRNERKYFQRKYNDL